jgi:hypothetical protein
MLLERAFLGRSFYHLAWAPCSFDSELPTFWSSWARMPLRSMLRLRQNSISARGPASSPISELSWLLTT